MSDQEGSDSEEVEQFLDAMDPEVLGGLVRKVLGADAGSSGTGRVGLDAGTWTFAGHPGDRTGLLPPGASETGPDVELARRFGRDMPLREALALDQTGSAAALSDSAWEALQSSYQAFLHGRRMRVAARRDEGRRQWPAEARLRDRGKGMAKGGGPPLLELPGEGGGPPLPGRNAALRPAPCARAPEQSWSAGDRCEANIPAAKGFVTPGWVRQAGVPLNQWRPAKVLGSTENDWVGEVVVDGMAVSIFVHVDNVRAAR